MLPERILMLDKAPPYHPATLPLSNYLSFNLHYALSLSLSLQNKTEMRSSSALHYVQDLFL